MEPSRGKSICVPFDSQEPYATCVTNPESFRQPLLAVFGQPPELLPARLDEGFVLHDTRCSLTQTAQAQAYGDHGHSSGVSAQACVPDALHGGSE